MQCSEGPPIKACILHLFGLSSNSSRTFLPLPSSPPCGSSSRRCCSEGDGNRRKTARNCCCWVKTSHFFTKQQHFLLLSVLSFIAVRFRGAIPSQNGKEDYLFMTTRYCKWILLGLGDNFNIWLNCGTKTLYACLYVHLTGLSVSFSRKVLEKGIAEMKNHSVRGGWGLVMLFVV